MREIQKSVALVVREFDQHFELLVFDHPNAGTQVVKGTVERGESPEQAVIRELEEESGLVVDHPGKFVGTWDYTAPGILGEEHHTWHLFWIAAPSGHESTWDHRPSGRAALKRNNTASRFAGSVSMTTSKKSCTRYLGPSHVM